MRTLSGPGAIQVDIDCGLQNPIDCWHDPLDTAAKSLYTGSRAVEGLLCEKG